MKPSFTETLEIGVAETRNRFRKNIKPFSPKHEIDVSDTRQIGLAET